MSDLNNLAFLNTDSFSDHDEDRLDEIRNDFGKYARFMLGESFPFLPFHQVVCDRITKCLEEFKVGGRTKTGFYMPPRHGKTLFFCDLLFTYLFGRFPDARCLYRTYNEELASMRKQAVEKMLSSEEYRVLFPKALTRDTIEDLKEVERSKRKLIKNTVFQITNVQSMWGILDFGGRGTKTTGQGYDVAVVDDPYKDYEEASSVKVSESIKKWYKWTVETRLEADNVSGNMLFLTYTRWVSDDITGMLEEYSRGNSDPFYIPLEQFVFPAEMDREKSWYDQREMGEPLNPYKRHEYATMKKDMELWMAMCQQRPLDMVYALFKLDHFPRHTSNAGMTRIVIVVDTTFREKTTTGDRTAIAVYGMKGNKSFLMEFVNRKMDFPEQLAVTSHFARKYPYWAIVIETKANGDALLSTMKKRFIRCVGVEPLGKNKKERAQMVKPSIEAGQVSLPDESICPNVHEFISQIIGFTGKDGEIDDLMDTLVYYVSYIEQFIMDSHASVSRIEDPVAKRYLPQGQMTQNRLPHYRARQMREKAGIISHVTRQLGQMNGFR